MLTKENARKIGIQACINKLGYDFCKKYADNSTSSWGEIEEGVISCFIGISTDPAPQCDITKVKRLVLTSGAKWPYAVRCNVYLDNGNIEFTEVRIPVCS